MTFKANYFPRSHLSHLIEVIGFNLRHLLLFHIEEMSYESVILIATSCPQLVELKFENCSFLNTTNNEEGSEEPGQEEIDMLNLRMPLMLELKTLTLASELPLPLVMILLKKVLNIKQLQINVDTGITDDSFVEILRSNSLENLENLLILSSR